MAERADASSYLSGADDRSLTDIIRSVLNDVGNIVRAEIRLGRTELIEKAREAKRPAALLCAASIAGFFAMACLIATCVAVLALVLQVWASALLTGVLLGLLAAGLYSYSRRRLQKFDPVPKTTISSVKDEIQWVKNRPSYLKR
jgi:hypothetical protein